MIDLKSIDSLNSMTKYPSIPTYHKLDPKNGTLLEDTVKFANQVILTEKIDGTNARIIMFPDGKWILGSREELLYAKGDLIGNSALGIVKHLASFADQIKHYRRDMIETYYLELYGAKIGKSARNYTHDPLKASWRLFDVSSIDMQNFVEMQSWPLDKIASWRDNGGQTFLTEMFLKLSSIRIGTSLTPRLGTIECANLPSAISLTHNWLSKTLPTSYVSLDLLASAKPEGIVLRSYDRTTIAKARFEDYERMARRIR